MTRGDAPGLSDAKSHAVSLGTKPHYLVTCATTSRVVQIPAPKVVLLQDIAPDSPFNIAKNPPHFIEPHETPKQSPLSLHRAHIHHIHAHHGSAAPGDTPRLHPRHHLAYVSPRSRPYPMPVSGSPRMSPRTSPRTALHCLPHSLPWSPRHASPAHYERERECVSPVHSARVSPTPKDAALPDRGSSTEMRPSATNDAASALSEMSQSFSNDSDALADVSHPSSAAAVARRNSDPARSPSIVVSSHFESDLASSASSISSQGQLTSPELAEQPKPTGHSL